MLENFGEMDDFPQRSTNRLTHMQSQGPCELFAKISGSKVTSEDRTSHQNSF